MTAHALEVASIRAARPRRAAAVCLMLLVAGCAGDRPPLPQAGSAAAQVYAQRCGSCHAVPAPQRLSLRHWRGRIVALDDRQMPVIDAGEKASVLAHMASPSPATARAYRRRCGACHAAPDADGLAPEVWRRRLVIMDGRMPVFAEGERQAVIAYLRRHGR